MKFLSQDKLIAKMWMGSEFGENRAPGLAATGVASQPTAQHGKWMLSTDSQGDSEQFAGQDADRFSRTCLAPMQPQPTHLAATAPPPDTDDLSTPARPLRPLHPRVTTLVVRNIPARYNQERLLQEWVPDGTFNLLYVPYNILERRSRGYAYLNFNTHQDALAFQLRWHGRRFQNMSQSKHLDVATATRQGVQANLELLRGQDIERLNARGYLPVLFKGRRPVDSMPSLRRLGIA